MLLYFKEMAVFLNNLYNVNYAAMLIFLKIIILFNTILNPFLEYLYFLL